ncbi:MAG: hypothetical protein K6E20_02285 [Acholeplasmatales bacterium]|nr:hypothetical protein [Acholeplasmatales bacterium]
MKHIITKETMKYLEEVKPKQFYSYALFKNIFGDDDIPYDSFRKVLVRREKEGLLKCIGKGLYEYLDGNDSNYLINEFINDCNGCYIDLKEYINDIGFNSSAIFTKVAGENGLILPDGTEVYQCDIEYNEDNIKLIKFIYAYRKLSFAVFYKIKNIDYIKLIFDMKVFEAINKELKFNDSLKRLLFKQLDIN